MLTSRLGGFTGLRVADLFAGSGALGLEALSRGATDCIFVERDKAALSALQANIKTLGASNADIRTQSVESLAPLSVPLDLLLMDPPYGGHDVPSLITRLIETGWIGADTIVTVEEAAGNASHVSQLTKIADRKVGKALLSFYRGLAAR